jgi:diguanylate cyclase (GGDEF)-like protein
MHSLADYLASGIIVVDQHLRVLDWNRWMSVHSGVAQQEAIGHALDQLLTDLPAATLKRRVKAALQLRSPSYLQPSLGYLFAVPLERVVDSNFLCMQQRIRILPYEGEQERAIIVVDDVTATREAEARAAAAAQASQRYLEVIDGNVMTLSFNTAGRVTRASTALLQATGWCLDTLIGQSLQTLELGRHGEMPTNPELEFAERNMLRADGSHLWVRIRPAMGLAAGGGEHHLVLQDISLQKKIQELSERDTLTGAYNRMKFDQLLRAALSAHQRYQQPFSIVLCDLDHFKRINDEHGHLAGDAVLKQFAQLLRTYTRVSDEIARWGGEEFVILLPMASQQEATIAAEKLRQAIVAEQWPAVETLSASFGVATHRPEESGDALLDRADGALYRAKKLGRNRVCTAAPPAAEDCIPST